VIAGLWDVDDRSTADLMGHVYAEIAQGRSPAAALRAAKLAMIARGGAAAKPYYWAPFQLFIGSRVVP
jgi:CHAT domain-containing protein